jgi:hypothetical protein
VALISYLGVGIHLLCPSSARPTTSLSQQCSAANCVRHAVWKCAPYAEPNWPPASTATPSSASKKSQHRPLVATHQPLPKPSPPPGVKGLLKPSIPYKIFRENRLGCAVANFLEEHRQHSACELRSLCLGTPKLLSLISTVPKPPPKIPLRISNSQSKRWHTAEPTRAKSDQTQNSKSQE